MCLVAVALGVLTDPGFLPDPYVEEAYGEVGGVRSETTIFVPMDCLVQPDGSPLPAHKFAHSKHASSPLL